jgi:hypothetical protein
MDDKTRPDRRPVGFLEYKLKAVARQCHATRQTSGLCRVGSPMRHLCVPVSYRTYCTVHNGPLPPTFASVNYTYLIDERTDHHHPSTHNHNQKPQPALQLFPTSFPFSLPQSTNLGVMSPLSNVRLVLRVGFRANSLGGHDAHVPAHLTTFLGTM